MIAITKRLTMALAAAATLVAAGIAQAGGYPSKPVTLISPYGPGGAADLAARTLAANAPVYLGNGVIVTNRTGAAGVTGSTFVAKGRKDGYTLLLARVGSQAAVPAINRRIPYRWDEFTFLGLLETNPFALVVNTNSPYKTLDDIKAAVKSGKKLSYASAGVGTLLHIAMIMTLDEMGLETDAMKHIPFKGGGKANAAVIGGHVDIMFQNLSGVIGAIRSGQLRALAVSSQDRVASLQDVPTVAEAGYPGLGTVVGWSALYGPPSMDKAATAKWVEVLAKIKDDKSWNKMTLKLSSVPAVQSPDETKAFVENQYLKFKDVVDRLDLAIK